MPKQKTSNSTKTVTILDTETPTPTPIEKQQEFEYKYFKLDTSKLVSLIKKDLQATNEGSAFLSQYNKEDIIRYLQSPIASEKILRQISNLLYNLSPQYKRLLHYFSDMTRFDYVIDIASLKMLELPKEKVLDKYLKTAKYVDVMNIKHEFSKITKTIFIEDVFYGYTYMIPDHSFTIQRLNPDYCRLNGSADGCRRFQFDFSYFNSSKNRESLETNYASEFKDKYELYKENGKEYRWQELTLENSVCIKLQEELEYPIPFFASIFPDVFNLAEVKQLNISKLELENYILLVGKIPYLKENGVANNFGLDLDTALEFGNKIIQQIPDQTAFLLSPYDDIKDIHLGDKNQINKNSVAEAEASFWSASGTNMALFNSDKITEQSIRSSIQVDINLITGLYEQFARWTNRTLKLCIDDNFKISILDSTNFNFLELAKHYRESAIYGLPVKRELCAVLGLSPLEVESAIELESVLDFKNRFIPLTSSNTMSPDKINGRPSQQAEGSNGGAGKQQGEE